MSEQDFFFDDGDEKPAEESQESKGSKGSEPKKKAPVAKSRPSRPASSQAPSFWSQSVNMTVTSLVALIALLMGVIVGIVLPVGSSTSADTVPDPTASAPAPSLTPEQLESGQMPEGHPDLSGMSEGATPAAGGTATSAPDAEAPADGTEETPSE